MVKHHIRLNNSYVVKKDGKYFITSVKKPSVWKKMTEKQIDKCTKKDVTKTIKCLLKDNKVSSNINFITKKTKNKVRHTGGGKTIRKIMGGWPKIKTHKIMKGGWGPLPKVNQSSIGQKGGGWLGAMLERN